VIAPALSDEGWRAFLQRVSEVICNEAA